MSSYKPRQAVFSGTVPPDFRPQHPWDIPPSLDDVELVAKNLSSVEANHLARAMNRRQLELRFSNQIPVQRWWFVFHFIKPSNHGGQHHRRQQFAEAAAE